MMLTMDLFSGVRRPKISRKPNKVLEDSLDALKDSYELLVSLIEDARFVVFDTELTGLNLRNNSIVSIGAVKMAGGRIHLGDYFYRLVRPETELTGKSVLIHELTPDEVAVCPDIETLLPEFIEFCRNSVIVGHFVSLDLGFLNKELKRLYGRTLQSPAIDTQRIYRWLTKQQNNGCSYHEEKSEDLDLTSLAAKYRIPSSRAHNALDDAYVTAQLFQRFLSELPGAGIRNIADLIQIGRP